MEQTEFLKEYEKYSLEDLTRIYNDQVELFSPEERDMLYDLMQKKQHAPLPEPAKSMLWLYLISFLFPVGFLASAILLIARNKKKYNEKLSIRCGLCAIVGMMGFIIWWSNTH